jgi:hypothetical protein
MEWESAVAERLQQLDAAGDRRQRRQEPHESYLRTILRVLTQGIAISDVRATLADVARQSSDEQLKSYLAPVRRLLASPTFPSMEQSVKMPLPLERY